MMPALAETDLETALDDLETVLGDLETRTSTELEEALAEALDDALADLETRTDAEANPVFHSRIPLPPGYTEATLVSSPRSRIPLFSLPPEHRDEHASETGYQIGISRIGIDRLCSVPLHSQDEYAEVAFTSLPRLRIPLPPPRAARNGMSAQEYAHSPSCVSSPPPRECRGELASKTNYTSPVYISSPIIRVTSLEQMDGEFVFLQRLAEYGLLDHLTYNTGVGKGNHNGRFPLDQLTSFYTMMHAAVKHSEPFAYHFLIECKAAHRAEELLKA